MARLKTSWNELAVRGGFADAKTMFEALYGVANMSAAQIGLRLGVSHLSVRRELRRLGFKVRHRGGPYFSGLKQPHDLSLIPADKLFNTDADVLGKGFGVSRDVVYYWRRKRKVEHEPKA